MNTPKIDYKLHFAFNAVGHQIGEQIFADFSEDWGALMSEVERLQRLEDEFYFAPQNTKLDVHYSSKTNEWTTPQNLFDMLNESFDFTLDPCATEENAKCVKFFTQEQDGLKQDWSGYRAFVNPPYGRAIGKWVQKAYEESQKGTLVVMLIPARTDTKYWQNYVMKSAEIHLISGRVKFGNGSNSAPFPSAVVVFSQKYTEDSPRIYTMELPK